MDSFQKILVPVDLSDKCIPAIQLATSLAKCNNAKLVFCYVALPPLPPEALYVKEDLDAVILKEHAEFKQIVPSDLTIEYQHEFLRGNPGPEIVKLAKQIECDLIVLATHGRTGFFRWVLGSVAEYVIRHSQCPVVSVKFPTNAKEDKNDSGKKEESEQQPESSDVLKEEKPIAEPAEISKKLNHKSPFVTSAMSHGLPIREHDEMPDVITELTAANSTAAPVVNEEGKLIGILTKTDIERYLNLWQRLNDQDETVLDEIYDTNEFGIRRTCDRTFHLVRKHMTSPVKTLRNECHLRRSSTNVWRQSGHPSSDRCYGNRQTGGCLTA